MDAELLDLEKQDLQNTGELPALLVGQMVEMVCQGHCRVEAFGGNHIHRSGSSVVAHLNSLRACFENYNQVSNPEKCIGATAISRKTAKLAAQERCRAVS